MSFLKVTLFSCLVILFGCNHAQTNEKIPTSDVAPTTKTDNNIESTISNTTTTKTIVFFGNSLTAAYQLDPEDGFTSLIQNRLDSLGYNYKVVNAGLSGETTAAGLQRIDWIAEQPMDIFVLELGANDALRGMNLSKTYSNLQGIIDKVKEEHPDVKIVIAGMLSPPNMGSDYISEFAAIFPKLAKENDAALIPFLLKNVGGIPSLNLADRIHPNVEGHKILAENVWAVLKEVI